MKRKGIKNLIVDFGGVLIDLDRQRCLENFRELGLQDVEHTLDMPVLTPHGTVFW